jgi:hypothetical protein
MEQVHPNRTLFQELGLTRKGLFDHIGKEFLRAGAVAECMAVLDVRQFGQDFGALISV